MADRDIYLKIEQVPGYSPVDPDPMAPIEYRRDCMYNHGHEDGHVPVSEANARRLEAIVYREYYDPAYLVPVPDKIVDADVNEPAFHRRVPGTVLYAHPGERLNIHVFNGDTTPHSLHMHGLRYGADSDGSWPFGTQSSDGRRSDEICPGDTWTYIFDVEEGMEGAWPFHEHWQHISENVNRGLFGGLVVLPRIHKPPPRFELPKPWEILLTERLGPGPGPRRPVFPGGHHGGRAAGADGCWRPRRSCRPDRCCRSPPATSSSCRSWSTCTTSSTYLVGCIPVHGRSQFCTFRCSSTR